MNYISQNSPDHMTHYHSAALLIVLTCLDLYILLIVVHCSGSVQYTVFVLHSIAFACVTYFPSFHFYIIAEKSTYIGLLLFDSIAFGM